MNASSILRTQGWRGEGHGLQSHKREGSSRGLTKPLLVSQKHDSKGIGAGKKFDAGASQWWLRGLEDGLGALKEREMRKVVREEVKVMDRGKVGMGPEKTEKGGLNALYAAFVKGKGLGGTIPPPLSHSLPSSAPAPVASAPRPEVRGGRDEEREKQRKRQKRARGEEDPAATALPLPAGIPSPTRPPPRQHESSAPSDTTNIADEEKRKKRERKERRRSRREKRDETVTTEQMLPDLEPSTRPSDTNLHRGRERRRRLKQETGEGVRVKTGKSIMLGTLHEGYDHAPREGGSKRKKKRIQE